MAGDWIKMEVGTPDKPEIWAIAQDLNIDPDAVFGKLFRIWAWFDQQTENGNAPSVTKMLLDRQVGVTGFCEAMICAGWMLNGTEAESVIILPNFDRHNGETAKRRALTAKRVAKNRIKSNATSNADVTLDALPREEKRREDNKDKDKDKDKKTIKKFTDFDFDCAEYFFSSIKRFNPNQKPPNLESWACEINKIIRLDNRPATEIEGLIDFAHGHHFWQSNLLSPVKLRKHWDKLTVQKNTRGNSNGKPKESGFEAGDRVGAEWLESQSKNY